MPATKHDYGEELGTLTQSNFKFLKKLWATGSTLRDDLFNERNEERLRATLGDLGVKVDEDVKIVIVDIEKARIQSSFVNDPQRQNFYALVLPPAPRLNAGNAAYQTMQAWGAAYYHAVNDSYGM
jgi:hypothetical protein